MENHKKLDLSSAALHILAMALMLCDHLWGTILSGNDWLTCLGRIAFPIFAFMIVEGYFHTKNLKKYVLRLLFWAILSEIPFNLALGSRLFYPIHQNVLWTFLMAIGLIHWNERTRASGKLWLRFLIAAVTLLLGTLLGILTFVDYHHAGVLTVLVFYFCRGRKWWHFVAQLLCLWYLNVEVLSGYAYQIELFGRTFFLVRQCFALLALIPIWLYRGRQGHHSRPFQLACYAFYPLHLLILALIKML
jgi:hypothetical protein